MLLTNDMEDSFFRTFCESATLILPPNLTIRLTDPMAFFCHAAVPESAFARPTFMQADEQGPHLWKLVWCREAKRLLRAMTAALRDDRPVHDLERWAEEVKALKKRIGEERQARASVPVVTNEHRDSWTVADHVQQHVKQTWKQFKDRMRAAPAAHHAAHPAPAAPAAHHAAPAADGAAQPAPAAQHHHVIDLSVDVDACVIDWRQPDGTVVYILV